MRVKKKRIFKILQIILLLLFVILILSFLLGANWIMDVLLFFSNDTLCEDMNHDGVVDFCQYWEEGQLVRLEWDTNSDGKMDVRQEFTPEGEIFHMDSNYDGMIDFKETEIPEGKIRIEIDSDLDGSFDRVEIHKSN